MCVTACMLSSTMGQTFWYYPEQARHRLEFYDGDLSLVITKAMVTPNTALHEKNLVNIVAGDVPLGRVYLRPGIVDEQSRPVLHCMSPNCSPSYTFQAQ